MKYLVINKETLSPFGMYEAASPNANAILAEVELLHVPMEEGTTSTNFKLIEDGEGGYLAVVDPELT